MKYTVTVFWFSIMCIGCANLRTNIPKSHGETCKGITDDSPKKRKKATLSCKDKHILLDVAKYDESQKVRITAAKRLMDIKMVISLYRFVKTDDTLTKSEKKKFMIYIKKKFELLKKCPRVGYADVEKRKSAIYRCNNDLVKVFVAKYDFDDDVRLFAVGNIMSTESLKSLWRYLKADDSLSVKKKKEFQKRVIARAKTLSHMLRGSNKKPISDNRFVSNIQYDEFGMPIEKKINSFMLKKTSNAIKGKIDSMPETVRQAIAKSKAPKGCYNAFLRRNPYLGGRMLIRMTLAVGGKVKSVKIIENELNNYQMDNCIKKVVKRISFSLMSEAGTYEFPLNFTPSF